MLTSDLRLGNLVYKGELFPVEVVEVITELSIETDRHNLCDIKKFRPIPITEEYLLKLGFEYNELYANYQIKIIDGNINSLTLFGDGEWNYCNDSLNASCHFIKEVKYIHQLQNLYYSLTNTELCLTN